MEIQETLLSLFNIISSTGKLAVSQSGPSRNPWTAITPCIVLGEEMKIPFPHGFSSKNLKKRVRITFSTGPDKNGMEVCGDAIGRIIEGPDGASIVITPYRLKLFDASDSQENKPVLERRLNKWCFQRTTGALQGIKFWLRAMRAVSFPLSFFPIAIGSGLACIDGLFAWPVFSLALLGGMAAHAATNLISDYFDFVNGVDTTNALSSHTGVLVDELVAPERILIAAMSCFLLTAFTGGMLVMHVGWPVLLFGLAGIVGGFLYTGGPFAWKYTGLGELSTGFLMGPLMVLGSYYVQTRTISLASVLVSIAIGLLVSAVSWGNNMRDSFFDAQAGVTTLPVKLGPKSALMFLQGLVLLPYFLVPMAIITDRHLWPLIAVWFTLPWAIRILIKMGSSKQSFDALSKRAAHMILPLQVIKLHMRFCLLLLTGCVLLLVLPTIIRP
jgi:1,4-dihydroxy-2-naphthoate octaprenyltransferase